MGRRLDGVGVVLVDGDRDPREVTALMLEWLGARVKQAGSLAEAARLAKRGGVDVVVCLERPVVPSQVVKTIEAAVQREAQAVQR